MRNAFSGPSLAAGVAALALLASACGRVEEPAFADRTAAVSPEDAPVPEPRPPVAEADGLEIGEVTYGVAQGVKLDGYHARPAAEPKAAVLVIHSVWGLDGQTESRVRELAAAGYAVLAVDLFGGRIALNQAAAQVLEAEAMVRQPAVEENLHQAIAFLEGGAEAMSRGEGEESAAPVGDAAGGQTSEDVVSEDRASKDRASEDKADEGEADEGEMDEGEADDSGPAPSIGVIGWGLGATWALRLALALPEQLDAAVLFYGQPMADEEALATLSTPVLGLYGADDDDLSVAEVRRFQELLASLDKEHDIGVYAEAGQGFANPASERYQAFAAEDGWTRALTFLQHHLIAETANAAVTDEETE